MNLSDLPVWWDLAAAIVITVAVWSWTFFWPTEGATSVADFTGLFQSVFRLIISLAVSAVIWIAYFVVH